MLKTINDSSLNRYIAISAIIVIVFSILIIKFFQLQVLQHNKYKEKANINSIRAVSLHAPRGSIIDRNGKIIVDNAPTYYLNARPNIIGDIDSLISKISHLIDVDSTLLSNNYHKNYIGYFAPVRLIKDLSFQQISLLEEHKLELPGIEYKHVQERNYPSGINGSHFLGYVVEVDRENIQKIADPDEYKVGDFVGWQGIEKSHEKHLKEQRGVEYKAIDAYGRIIGSIADENKILPKPGNNLITSIDSELQILIEKLLNGRRGCVIVGDPTDGSILSYVSSPNYPPDLFTGATSSQDWKRIITDPDKPLLNRLARGLYPPGSTLKMVVLAYILENNIVGPDRVYYCSGKYRFGNRVFGCWDENGHGNVNLDKALIESCDVYFYNVIQIIPLDGWAEMCRQFGFGSKTGIDLPAESIGTVPDVKYFDSRYGKNRWTAGHKLNISIGQGDMLVTPIQLFSYINLIFTNGNTKQTHFADYSVIDDLKAENISTNTWNRLNKLLIRVVSSKKGTGKLADPKIEGLVVAGKTGTAENPHGDPHAWFIGYATKDDVHRSFVILLENAGHGGDEAAPIAREILSFIYGEPEIKIDEPEIVNNEN